DAVGTCKYSARSGDGGGPGCEDPLPDILGYHHAQTIEEEILKDLGSSDMGDIQVGGRNLVYEGGEAPDVGEGPGQHDEEHADGHDDKLDHVGHGDTPHTAQQSIKDDDSPADDHGGRQLPAEDRMDDGSHADHLCHRHHDRIDHRYAGADQTGLIAVFES